MTDCWRFRTDRSDSSPDSDHYKLLAYHTLHLIACVTTLLPLLTLVDRDLDPHRIVVSDRPRKFISGYELLPVDLCSVKLGAARRTKYLAGDF